MIKIIFPKREKTLEYLKVSIGILRLGKPLPSVRKRQTDFLSNSDIKLAAIGISEGGNRLSELGRLYLLGFNVQKVPFGVAEHFLELLVRDFVNRYWHSKLELQK